MAAYRRYSSCSRNSAPGSKTSEHSRYAIAHQSKIQQMVSIIRIALDYKLETTMMAERSLRILENLSRELNENGQRT